MRDAARRLWAKTRPWAVLGILLFAVARGGPAGAQSLWDDPAFALYHQGVEAMNRKDYAAAEHLAGQAIEQYPTHVLAYYLKGQAELAQSKWEAAAAAFAKVTELYPGSFAAQRDLAVAYQQLGRTDDAVRAYEAAIALRPEDDEQRVQLAFMLVKAGQQARALPMLQALAERDTRVPDVWNVLGRVAYENGDLAASEKDFARAASLRDDGRTWFNLGIVRVRLGDRRGALDAFERAAAHAETKVQAAGEIQKLKVAPKDILTFPPLPAPAMPTSPPSRSN